MAPDSALRPATVPFDSACARVESILAGGTRRAIAEEVSHARDLETALVRLRDSMRAHAWRVSGQQVALGRMIREYDAITRAEGFHVLNDWDGKADRVNEDTIAVDVLNYVAGQRGRDAADGLVAAILIDYYFVNVLALLSLRVWDNGDADANLDRLGAMLAQLQGSDGSGQPFVADAETLLLIATAHYEAVEVGYERLLDRVRTLSERHRMHVALGHSASMGSHLRFGFEASYARDTVLMRDDNVADYPWLCWALAELMEHVDRADDGAAGAADDVAQGFSPASGRAELVESLFSGLSADPRAFLGQPPSSLSAAERDRARFAGLYQDRRDDLLTAFETLRPADRAYSPLSFFFNFSHNVLKGTVVDALLKGRVWKVTFNDLLTGIPPEPADGPKHTLATTLMGYARRNPDRIRGRPMPVIVYDPSTGREAFSAALRKLKMADG